MNTANPGPQEREVKEVESSNATANLFLHSPGGRGVRRSWMDSNSMNPERLVRRPPSKHPAVPFNPPVDQSPSSHPTKRIRYHSHCPPSLCGSNHIQSSIPDASGSRVAGVNQKDEDGVLLVNNGSVLDTMNQLIRLQQTQSSQTPGAPSDDPSTTAVSAGTASSALPSPDPSTHNSPAGDHNEKDSRVQAQVQAQAEEQGDAQVEATQEASQETSQEAADTLQADAQADAQAEASQADTQVGARTQTQMQPQNSPATDAPATDAPVRDAPVRDAPVRDSPATDAPATDAPVSSVQTGRTATSSQQVGGAIEQTPAEVKIDDAFWYRAQLLATNVSDQPANDANPAAISVDAPRARLLRDACTQRDFLYLAFHQLYCYSTCFPGEYAALPTFVGKSTQGLHVLEQLLMPNRRMSPEFLHWSTRFPYTQKTMMTIPEYRQALNHVPLCLQLLHDRWALYESHVRARAYPPLVDEMVELFGVTSSVMLYVMFVALSRHMYSQSVEPRLRELFILNKRAFDRRFMASARAPVAQVQHENGHLIASYLALNPSYDMTGPLRIIPPLIGSGVEPIPRFFQGMASRFAAQARAPDQIRASQMNPIRVSTPIQMSPAQMSPAQTSAPQSTPAQMSTPQMNPVQMGIPVQTNARPYITPYLPVQNGTPRPLVQQAFGANPQTRMVTGHAGAVTTPVNGHAGAGPRQVGISTPQAGPQARMVTGHAGAVATQANGNASAGATPNSSLVIGVQANGPARQQPGQRQQGRGRAVPSPTTNLLPAPGTNPVTTVRPNPLRVGLHQAHLRDPRLHLIRKKPDTSDTEEVSLLQYFRSLKVGPVPLGLVECSFDFQFSLDGADIERLTRLIPRGQGHRSIRVVAEGDKIYRLRCIKTTPKQALDTHLWNATDTTWPSVVYIFVNDVEFFVRRKFHNGKDLPLDITDKLRQGANKVSFHMLRNGAESKKVHYAVGIESMYVGTESEARHLCGIQLPDSCRERLQHRLQSRALDEDLSIVNDDLTINLIDPFTARVCDRPARGAQCIHPECFDHWTFIHTLVNNSGFVGPMKDNWKCPICNADASPQNLVIDAFLVEVIGELRVAGRLDSARALRFKADGSWEVKFDDPDPDPDAGAGSAAAAATSTVSRKRKHDDISNSPDQGSRAEATTPSSGPAQVIEID